MLGTINLVVLSEVPSISVSVVVIVIVGSTTSSSSGGIASYNTLLPFLYFPF